MPEAKATSDFRVLLLGFDEAGDSTLELLKALIPEKHLLRTPYDLEKFLENPPEPSPAFVLCGPPPEGIALIEVAQMLRMQYQENPILYLTSSRQNFDRKDFQKNGFSDAFLVPIDNATLAETIKGLLSKASGGLLKSYREVKLIDLSPGETLEFDTYVYLPANKKHLKFSVAGDQIDPERIERLKRHQLNSVHVSSDQIQHFYDYTASKLRALSNTTGLSETERREKMQSAVRDLMASIFNDSTTESTVGAGRSLVADAQEIVKSFVVGPGAEHNNWYSRLMAVVGARGTAYSHAANVSTFATLFSMSTGIGKPEDLALAGLLHDMGMADVPPTVQAKEARDRTPEEELQYQKHVDHTLSLIKFRKMILPEPVLKAIAQHHEKFNGGGFPKGLAGKRIAPEAQLLAIADAFDYLTIAKDGRPRMLPRDAFKILRHECDNLSTTPYDPEIIQKLTAMFEETKE
jgi:HD-GYP domain-containing protein (c-di-GMP phosphodiesterase class II)